jgi:cell division septation protein DedD
MAKEGRTGLGFLDRVVLLLAWVTTCGVVYALGVYVGKGMQEHHPGIDERMVRLPVISKPPPEGQRPKTDSDLTFWDTLGAGEHPPERPERAAPPAAKPTSAPAPPPAPAPAASATATAKPAAPPVSPPAAAPPPPAARPPSSPTAAVTPPLAAAPAPAAPPLAHPAPALPPAAPPAAGGWTVQASPTRSREEAEALEQKLKARGYDAVVVRLSRDGDIWYRVRIGRYATSAQATDVMQRLREHEGVSHAFVASE